MSKNFKNILIWAMDRADVKAPQLAKKMHVKENLIGKWINEEATPTFSQICRLAKALYIPLGYFYLSEPPEEKLPINDFRSINNKSVGEMSPDLKSVLYDAMRKRDWYSDWRKTEGFNKLEFVGQYKVENGVDFVADAIEQILELEPEFYKKHRNWQESLSRLAEKAENAGIIVLQSGVVENNTSRKLKVSEFRGFALVDEYAPIIFVNSADSNAARIFTLIHEIAHILLGESGIIDANYESDDLSPMQMELFCNKVAAEVLVPSDDFVKDWNPDFVTVDLIEALASKYKIGAQVILRKALDLGLVEKQYFFFLLQEVKKQEKPIKGSKGNYYRSFFARNSKTLTKDITIAVMNGRVSYHDGAQLLNTKAKTFNTIFNKMLEGV